MIYVAAFLVLSALCLAVAAWQSLRCGKPEPEPVSGAASRYFDTRYVDECETCGRRLTADECHVLRSSDVDDVERELVKRAGGFGGTYMSATYCAEHYPQTLDSASSGVRHER